MLDRLEALGLQPLRVKGRQLLPIVQGGMGVGISAHRLASAVARENAVGTIASVDLRHHHADLMEQCKDVRDRTVLDRLNLIALDREIRSAKEQSRRPRPDRGERDEGRRPASGAGATVVRVGGRRDRDGRRAAARPARDVRRVSRAWR